VARDEREEHHCSRHTVSGRIPAFLVAKSGFVEISSRFGDHSLMEADSQEVQHAAGNWSSSLERVPSNAQLGIEPADTECQTAVKWYYNARYIAPAG
jgi:hypothetical protein